MQRILPRFCVFKTCEIYMFDTPVLGQFLSDFARVKSNVSPRPSTLTYPREIFDRTTPLKTQKNTALLVIDRKNGFHFAQTHGWGHFINKWMFTYWLPCLRSCYHQPVIYFLHFFPLAVFLPTEQERGTIVE